MASLVSFFTPPASWILGAALGCLLPWWAVPSTFVALAIVLSGISMHRLALDWMPPGAAVAAALFYAVNPYQLVVIYLRSDFAELLASAIFPLAVYYTLRCGASRIGPSDVPSGTARWRNALGLALIYALIWFCNAPAAVVFSYALALLLVVQSIGQGSLAPLREGAAGLAAGLMLASIYIVPAAYERKWVDISQVLSSGLRPEQNFLFTSILDAEHNLFNIKISTIGVIAVALALVGAALSYRRAPNRRGGWAPFFALAAVSALLMTPASATIWRYAPELRYVQFPWRWLIPLDLCAAFFFAQTLAYSRRPRAESLCFAVVLALTGVTIVLGPVSRPSWNSEDLSMIQAQVQTERGYEGTDEYFTRDGDRTDLPQSAPPVALLPATGRVHLEDWQPERKEFTVDAPVTERAAVRLLNYPSWQVRVNGQITAPESIPGTNQLWVQLPPGDNCVEIRLRETPDREVGAAISVIAALLLTATVIAERRKAKAAG